MVYPKEPFNFKLFMTKMLNKWYQFVLCICIGSLLFGCTYYMYKVCFAPAREYQAKATYYMEYATDPKLNEPYSYFNEYTLNSWLNTDAFVDNLPLKTDGVWTKEALAEAVVLTVPSDVRVIQLTITTADALETMNVLTAYDKALQEFATRQREINEIVVQDMPTEATQIKADIRTQRAFVLGGLLGLLFGGLYIVMKYLLDDGIYAPHLLATRHGLKVLGTNVSDELKENVSYALKGMKKVAVTSIGDTPELPVVQEKLQAFVEGVEVVAVPSMVQCPEQAEVLRTYDGVILTVMYEVDKSRAIDRALSYYEGQDVKVLGAMLWDVKESVFWKYLK